MELWKNDSEFGNYYEVSNKGQIRNKKGKILKQELHSTGCYRIRLCICQKKFSRSVHRMVANTFISNPKNKPEVNHIDGNRLNNKLENLEWVTKQENMNHAVETGLINNPFGKDSRNSKFRITVFDLSGKLLHICYGNKDLKNLGFDYRNVHSIFKGKQKTHRKHIFKREEINK